VASGGACAAARAERMEMKTFTRRSVTGALALATATIAPPAHAQSRESKTFVLVHGAWHGGWCWRRVSDLLEQHGHKVFSPTFTGLGERSHLLSRDVSLETHVTDVANVIKWEGLTDIVLVAHWPDLRPSNNRRLVRLANNPKRTQFRLGQPGQWDGKFQPADIASFLIFPSVPFAVPMSRCRM
jgi:hypothetical protein